MSKEQHDKRNLDVKPRLLYTHLSTGEGVDEQVCPMLGAGTQREHGKNLGARVDGQPEKDARVASCAIWYAVHPAGGAGAGDGRRCAHARSVHARQRA